MTQACIICSHHHLILPYLLEFRTRLDTTHSGQCLHACMYEAMFCECMYVIVLIWKEGRWTLAWWRHLLGEAVLVCCGESRPSQWPGSGGSSWRGESGVYVRGRELTSAPTSEPQPPRLSPHNYRRPTHWHHCTRVAQFSLSHEEKLTTTPLSPALIITHGPQHETKLVK